MSESPTPTRTRRLLKQDEIDKVTRLQELYSATQANDFACSGLVPKGSFDVDKMAVFFNKMVDGQGTGPVQAVSIPLSPNSAHALFEAGEQSPFGQGKDLVYDQNYRHAHEFKAPYFALSLDLISSFGLLSRLAHKLNYDTPLHAKLNKLNAYPAGGFFKAHKDTPQGKNHIGTLMFCLPSSFTGGDLVIRQNGCTVAFDWSKQVKDGQVAWGFLYSDCEHEVLPVESGTRVTVSYDVYLTSETGLPKELSYDTRIEPICQAFDKLLDPSFMPEGCQLAFGLVHGYPQAEKDFRQKQDIPSKLKGRDALLLSVIKKSGLSWEKFAVFDTDKILAYQREDEEPAQKKRRKALEKEQGIDPTFQSDMWYAKDVWGDDDMAMLDTYDPDELGLKRDLDLVWVSHPKCYAVANSYCTYGNEPQRDTIYAAMAIKVTLPPATQRKQTSVSSGAR